MAKSVLIVEDSAAWTSPLQIALESLTDVETVLTQSAAEGLRLLAAGAFDALVTDLNMPGMDGFELIARLPHALPVVVISGDTDPDTPARLKKLGVAAYFPKPFSPASVRARLEQILYAHSLPDPML